jgi:zinc protease
MPARLSRALALLLASAALAQQPATPTTPPGQPQPNPALPAPAQTPKDPAGPATPLPTDPRLVTGTLDNGLTYIVRRHDNPPGRAAIWMHVDTGSLNETEKQRGLAHYMEHMAFNGSEHFPPNSVIDFFQSLGLTFGQHQNAFTSFDQTTYQLALPDNKPETLDKAMSFFSDVASRLLLLPKEIDEERQVILEERRTRLSGRQRVQDYYFERLAPGSIFGRRIPIGTEESIKALTPEDFHDYYTRWYVPSNMTVMVVADADPAPIVEQIKKFFSGAKAAPKPTPQDIGVKPYEATRAIVASDNELTSADVGITWIYPPEPPVTTDSGYRRQLVEAMGSWIFNRRLQRKISEGAVAFQSGLASASDLFRAGYLASAGVHGEPSKWRTMLGQLCVEIQRAHLHGFTDQELADARKEFLASAERAVETEATEPAQGILSSWNSSIADQEPIMSAQQELDVMKRLISGVTLQEVAARFNQLFDPARPVTFTLQMPSSRDVPTEEQLVEIGAKALDVKPEAEAQLARADALLKEKPAPGTLTDFAQEPVAEVWSGWLGNNARVHYRFMDYRKDQVSIVVSLAGGEIEETADTRGITQAASIAWGRSQATGSLSSNQIRDLMTGHKINVGGGGGTDTFTLQVAGSPAELETGLQLAYLLLTDPKVEDAALDQWKVRQKQAAALRKLSPEGVFSELIGETIYPAGEPRVKPLEPEQIDRVTPEAATAWLKKHLQESPIEIAIVGDIDRQKAMDLVTAYLGALPSRERINDRTLDSLRRLDRPTGPLSASRSVTSKTDKAVVLSGFYGADYVNVKDVRLLNIASRILSTRAIQQIREARQLAYAPSVSSRPSVIFPGFGLVACASPTDPHKAKDFVAAIREMYDAFAKDGPTAEELDTARKQIANSLDETMREPDFWLGATANLTYRGTHLRDIADAPAAYQALTADEITAAFNRYYTPEATFTITVTPEPAATPDQSTKPDTQPAPTAAPDH